MITRQQILDAVCEEYGLELDELLSVGSKGARARARAVACQAMHDAGWSWAEAGKAIGLGYRGVNSNAYHLAATAPASELSSVRLMVGLAPGWPPLSGTAGLRIMP